MRYLLGVVLIVTSGLVVVPGCEDGGDGDADAGVDGDADADELDVELQGSVQKGPFVIGSSIAVSILDDDLDPTGGVFNTETLNDRGEFEISFPASGPVSLEGDGYYYNEVTGALSVSTLTLRAFYVPEEAGVQSAYINMVTHVTTHRIKALVTGGAAFVDAVIQAEGELLVELDVTPPDFSPGASGTEMSLLGGDTDSNAYLLAVGAVLIQIAVDRGGSVEANLQELLNTYSRDLEDGSLDAVRDEEIAPALLALDTEAIEQQLVARLGEIGSNATAPDMDRVLDQDRDGWANTADCLPRDPEGHPGAAERCNDLDDDCDGVVAEDVDLDGFLNETCDGDDCDDGDPGISPGSPEACGDAVDEDCSGAPDDLDCDGYDSTEHGGTDCDDGDPDFNPGADDPAGDDVDSNCDGVDGVAEFAPIEGGTFTMGSPESELGRWEGETQHEVTLTRDFEIMTAEVTQGQFEELMGYNPSGFPMCGADCPVETVNWHEAAAYSNARSDAGGLGRCYDCEGGGSMVECEPSGAYVTPYDCPGYRLPTEAEWEYAARAGTTTTTYQGDLAGNPGLCASAVLDPIAWYCGNADEQTHPARELDPNGWGLYDMLGNVNEWCHDWFDDYSGAAATDPWGPEAPPVGSWRMWRGGSSLDLPWSNRAAYRQWGFPGDGSNAVGFRLARSL